MTIFTDFAFLKQKLAKSENDTSWGQFDAWKPLSVMNADYLAKTHSAGSTRSRRCCWSRWNHSAVCQAWQQSFNTKVCMWVMGKTKKKKDDTQPQSPVQNRIKPPPPTLVWTLQMARSQLENRLCFVKECTSPTRQVRVRGKRNHRSTHALTRPPLLSPVRAFSAGWDSGGGLRSKERLDARRRTPRDGRNTL